jgi:hypothetical protein
MKHLILLNIVVLLVLMGCSREPEQAAPVSTEEAAIIKAKKAWPLIYEKTKSSNFSQKNAARFEPYHASLEDEQWVVRGTMPPGFTGVTLVTYVRKADGATRVDAVAIR